MCTSVPEVQVFGVFQTSVDELFKLAVDFWHKLRERKLLREGKLEEKSKRIMIERHTFEMILKTRDSSYFMSS